jgi:hypothetical protein
MLRRGAATRSGKAGTENSLTDMQVRRSQRGEMGKLLVTWHTTNLRRPILHCHGALVRSSMEANQHLRDDRARRAVIVAWISADIRHDKL